MTFSSPMRSWAPLLLPIIFPVILLFALTFCPGAPGWIGNPFFLYMPQILFGAAFMLGGLFTQSRISFISIMFMAVTHLVNHSFFVSSDPAKGSTVILLASIYLPPFIVLLYHLRERGIFTLHGYTRIMLVLSALIVIFILPQIRNLANAALSARSALFRPVGSLCYMPLIGLLVFLVCAPLLLIRNQHESPLLGKILFAAMLFLLGGLNFRADFWKVECEQTALISFMSAAGIALVWAVLESSWRSAHIDELTELPGRRALKHHLARLIDQFVIAVVDVDHFKKINDKFGHHTGDQVLRFIAAQLREKGVGEVYRYGGEEFVIIFEESTLEKKLPDFDDLRKSVESREFLVRAKSRPRKKPDSPHQKLRADASKSIAITISIGVAENNSKHPTPNEVLEAADKALYRAKESGRNCVKTAR